MSILRVETVPHRKRLESGTLMFYFRFLPYRLQLYTATDSFSQFHKLLIYLYVWKPVAA